MQGGKRNNGNYVLRKAERWCEELMVDYEQLSEPQKEQDQSNSKRTVYAHRKIK
jgi:hypothetical protein